MSATLITEQRGAVLVATIDRPATRNAIDASVAAGLEAAWAELDASPDLQVGVVTGAAGVFSSGMDLKAFAGGGRLDDTFLRNPPAKPVVAAIEGFALAAGLELALACDLIVAARDARLGLPEVTRGLVASGGGVARLAARIPYHVALELVLTGEPIEAVRAAEIGLVNRLAEPGHALDVAFELAALVARCGPLALKTSKRLAQEQPREWERQREIAEPVLGSADALEGARAFAEKRPPRFSGR